MKSIKKTSFTTQWESNNVLIDARIGTLTNYFLNIFFKGWILLRPKKAESRLVFKFSTECKGKSIKTPLFYYSREIKENQITTVISKPKIFRSMIRSIYKFINKNTSVVGISELYMAIIRKAIIEPIEYLNYLKGWKMVHASVFRFNNKLFVLSAGSKVGKSTFVSKLKREHNCEILSDNYCFVKGNTVRTIEEPLRGGPPSRYKLSFYKRTINGYPSCFEGEIDQFIIMKRGEKNNLSKLNLEKLNVIIEEINNKEGEGIMYLDERDPVKISTEMKKIAGQYKINKLEVGEGLENISTAINLIKNI